MKKTAFDMNFFEAEMVRLHNVLELLNQAMELCDDCGIVDDEWHDIFPIKQSVEQRIDDLEAFFKIITVRYPGYFTEVEVEEEDFNLDNEGIDDWVIDALFKDFELEEEA